MKEILYMAWRYVSYHRGKMAVLTTAITLIVFLPAGLKVVVDQAARMLTSRAESTPLLIGAKGSALDLTLSALYYRSPRTETIPYREVAKVSQTELATGIPLHLRYAAGRQRIVGTSLDYLEFRGLSLAQGRSLAMLGECVLGAKAARALGVDVGDHVLSSAGSAFDVAGSFPLKMPVVGILAPSGTPDDEIVLVDVKTAWIISGLAHGHRDVNLAEEGDEGVLAREERNVVANATVLSYTEITAENLDSFHFHGDPAAFPVDAVLAVPKDYRSGILLRGRYEEADRKVQMLVPSTVIDELLATMFSVRDYVILGSVAVGLATLMTAALVFVLSVSLRRREIETIRKIGGSSRRLIAIIATEIFMVAASGIALAVLLTVIASRFGIVLVRAIGG